jgi:RHS repeat-associated protein
MGGGSVVAQLNPNGNFYWLHLDHLGSGRKMTDSTGALVYRAEFDPYGKLLYEWSSPTNLNTRKFTGYERDAATNLDYAQARMYASDWGRFLSADKLGLTGARVTNPKSLNRYSYASGDPVNRVDRNGMEDIAWMTCSNCSVTINGGGDAAATLGSYGFSLFGGEQMFMIDDGVVGGSSGGGDPLQWGFQLNFQKFLTTMSSECKDALKTYLSNLDSVALSTQVYDLSEIGSEKALDYFNKSELDKYGLDEKATVNQLFQKRGDLNPNNAVAMPFEKKPGIYVRSNGTDLFTGDNMYFFLHEMFHMVFNDPKQDLDQMAVKELGITRGNRTSSQAVSDFFNTQCRQTSEDPPPPKR